MTDRSACSILVVDDRDDTRYAVCRTLQAAGFNTAEAKSGAMALQLVDFVNAVVLDVHLPDLHGFVVCREIRQRKASIPIVHMSAVYVRDEEVRSGLNAGADAYLLNPFDPQELVSTLDSLLDRAAGGKT